MLNTLYFVRQYLKVEEEILCQDKSIICFAGLHYYKSFLHAALVPAKALEANNAAEIVTEKIIIRPELF